MAVSKSDLFPFPMIIIVRNNLTTIKCPVDRFSRCQAQLISWTAGKCFTTTEVESNRLSHIQYCMKCLLLWDTPYCTTMHQLKSLSQSSLTDSWKKMLIAFFYICEGIRQRDLSSLRCSLSECFTFRSILDLLVISWPNHWIYNLATV